MEEGQLPKGRIISFACIGFVSGTGIFSFVKTLDALACLAAVLICIILFLLARHSRQLVLVQIIVVIVIGAVLGAWRYSLSYPNITPGHISYYNNKTISFSGIVNKEPAEKENGWQLTLRVDAIDQRLSSTKSLVLMSLPPLPVYDYGDRLRISCKLEKPENKDFAYDRYLARYHIYSLCNRPKIKIEEKDQGNGIMTALLKIKASAYRIAQSYMPEPTASLALPVVFGGNQGISEEITEQFRRTGLTHIMAVSGFNVSLITALIGIALVAFGLNRRMVFILTALIVSAYVLMVGAPASAVRAGVMSIFLLLALTVGRLASLPRSVLLVAVATLLVNPRLLRDDIGWQLSFLALLGLMYILPYLEKWTLLLTKDKGKVFITALMATVAAQLATAPVILYNFGNFSIIAPLANLLVVWMIPVLTITMMAVLPIAALFPDFGDILLFPAWLMVKYIFFIVQTLSGLPWAAVDFE